MGFTEKFDFYGGWCSRKTLVEGGLPKKGACTVWRFKGKKGKLARKRGGVFEGAGLMHQCTRYITYPNS